MAAQSYVHKLNDLSEQRRVELSDKVLSYMYMSKTFYHQGYELLNQMEPYLQELALAVQNTRDTQESEKELALQLMEKINNTAGEKAKSPGNGMSSKTMQGYLMVQRRHKRECAAQAPVQPVCLRRGSGNVALQLPCAYRPRGAALLPHHTTHSGLRSRCRLHVEPPILQV